MNEIDVNIPYYLFVGTSLFVTHLLTDFVLQSKKAVDGKRAEGVKSIYFWTHILLSATLPYLLLREWSLWEVPLIIFVTHGAIDYWKIVQEGKVKRYNESLELNQTKKTITKLFFIDQALHGLVLIILFIYITQPNILELQSRISCTNSLQALILATSVFFLISPSGISIGAFTEQFRNEFDGDDSLKKAGMYIGWFERILVFLFVLLGQFGGIGFLFASKSVLRIASDSGGDGRKKTEYVLIGTLISFTTAIIIGLITQGLFTLLKN